MEIVILKKVTKSVRDIAKVVETRDDIMSEVWSDYLKRGDAGRAKRQGLERTVQTPQDRRG